MYRDLDPKMRRTSRLVKLSSHNNQHVVFHILLQRRLIFCKREEQTCNKFQIINQS